MDEIENQTLTVQVKSLTVSGSKMTLSFFRQIPTTGWLGKDGEPQGKLWGWVNHHWTRCYPTDESHIHVLWERGGQLFQSVVKAPSLEESRAIGRAGQIYLAR